MATLVKLVVAFIHKHLTSNGVNVWVSEYLSCCSCIYKCAHSVYLFSME